MSEMLLHYLFLFVMVMLTMIFNPSYLGPLFVQCQILELHSMVFFGYVG